MSEMTAIKFTDKHLRVIETALEVYCRMKLGQFRFAIEEGFPAIRDLDDQEVLERVHMMLRSIIFKDVEFMQSSPHASYGITNESVGDGREAYEIRQVIRQYLGVKNNGGFFDHGFTTFDDPLKVSNEPLPTVEGWDKNLRVPIECEETNARLKELIGVKDFEQMWGVVDEFIKNHPVYSDVHYSKGEVVLREDGLYEIVMTKPYKRKYR